MEILMASWHLNCRLLSFISSFIALIIQTFIDVYGLALISCLVSSNFVIYYDTIIVILNFLETSYFVII